MQKENEMMKAFEFSATKQEIRSLVVENEPWFVAKDVCDVLEIQNNRQAIRELDNDEKLMYKLYTSGQNRKTWLISQSGLYALILRSNKPQAKTFRKWITSEVIPSLLKKGYYSVSINKAHDNVIDVRDIPYNIVKINDKDVKVVTIKDVHWFSINDYHAVIGSRTGATQTAKKLNKVKELACKIWLFGATNPSWFTTEVGLQLIASGSKKIQVSQLQLNLGL
ncbi:prophage antirepressor-like protein [Wenyingzhuangia heitensis]|uniref:Prophage antirepressor-like protein n=1 Tax=Wenyingzhuangia heitensis TaxID=1487859 RepID=A0ABX0U9K7_9FLAO|nr:Bro-N domain-containing protein [Wenyingzhuangia heitensis]NIJ45039.1 prophage antirepressor-like protein [Wenyingzhuangia heitensis]